MANKPLSSAEITSLVQGLNQLARNLWWTWDQKAQELFGELSPRGWQNLYHNAVAILHEVSDYELRVRLQEMFGLAKTPTIAKGRAQLRIELLSPAGRPLAVTKSLETFWTNGYPDVRAELRGRYPKHSWPEDPLSAPPVKPRKLR